MATYFIWQDGPNGSGTSESDTRRTVPAAGVGDVWKFKRGTTFAATAQIPLIAADMVLEDFGSASDPRPIITSTATNFGAINVQNTGVTTFRNLHFRNFLNSSTNGAAINCSVSGGRASSIAVQGCRFESTAWNAIRLNGTSTAEAANTFLCTDSEFDDIGEDAVFGCALDFRFLRNRVNSVSTRSLTGDCIGMINGDPNFVWIAGNYLDHSHVDIKQCIIIDTSGAATGIAIIEDNTMVGYGSPTVAPTSFVGVISDMPCRIRRNLMFCYGLFAQTNFSGDEISGNVFVIGNRDASNVIAAINATGGRVVNNTFLGRSSLPSASRAVVMAAAATSAVVQNNIFVDVPIAIESDSVGNNPTSTNNCFFGVTSPRLDASNNPFAGGSDVTGDPQLRGDYMPLSTAVRTAGTFLGGLDFYGKEFQSPPTIGAVQYQPPRGVVSRSIASRRGVTA